MKKQKNIYGNIGHKRAVWSGTSDNEIGGYSVTDQYCTMQINVGMWENPVPFSIENSGVRIIRIRSNQEVPDFFTDISVKSIQQPIDFWEKYVYIRSKPKDFV